MCGGTLLTILRVDMGVELDRGRKNAEKRRIMVALFFFFENRPLPHRLDSRFYGLVSMV